MQSGLTCQHTYARTHDLDDNSWTWNMLEVQRTKAQILSHSRVLTEKVQGWKCGDSKSHSLIHSFIHSFIHSLPPSLIQ